MRVPRGHGVPVELELMADVELSDEDAVTPDVELTAEELGYEVVSPPVLSPTVLSPAMPEPVALLLVDETPVSVLHVPPDPPVPSPTFEPEATHAALAPIHIAMSMNRWMVVTVPD